VHAEVDQFAAGSQNPIHLHEYRGHVIDVGVEVGAHDDWEALVSEKQRSCRRLWAKD